VSDSLRAIAAHYLAPIVEADCDTLVLGCTHYPLLTGVISYVVGLDVTLVSSAEETAKDVYRVLATHSVLRAADATPPTHRFLATGDPTPFETLGRRFLGPEIGAVSVAPLGLAAAGSN
jgi:glutamate racemase